MTSCRQRTRRSRCRNQNLRSFRLDLEGLESRVLLYSSLGDQWTYDSRITYSFMPDGTNVGELPACSSRRSTQSFRLRPGKDRSKRRRLSGRVRPTSTWRWFLTAAKRSGPPVISKTTRDSATFAIGMVPLSSSVLAVTFVPPEGNGGTDAGDILLNSTVNWQIGSNYDLMTVVAHEFGHALGLGESTVSSSVMYGTYNGIKQQLATDDIDGIDSIYGTRQFDQFNSGSQRNNTYASATNINSYVNNGQIAIPGLDITTSGDSEWFYVNVPSDTTGTMSVTVQSSNLSMLSPKVQVYNSSLSSVGQAGTTASLSATATVSTKVEAGQEYYIKVLAAGGPGPIGGYGLLVNFTSQSQAPIPPPNTMVASQPSTSSGSTSNDNAPTGIPIVDDVLAAIGSLTGLVDEYLMPGSAAGGDITAAVSAISSDADVLNAVVVSIAGTSSAAPDSNPVQLLDETAAAVLSAAAAPATTVTQAIDQSIEDGDLL